MQEEKLFEFMGTTLTSVRVRQRYKNFVSSALLSEVDGVAVVYRSHVWLLVLGILFLLGGFAIGAGGSAKGAAVGFPIFLGIIAIIIYFITRHVVMQVHAGDIVIREQVQGSHMASCIEFIDSLEHAKQQYEIEQGRQAHGG